MLKRILRQMLTAQIFSALTVSVCLLIDNVMTARFLGEEAIAAYGLANPVLLVIGALGSLLSAGVQVTCSRSLGRGSQAETNEGYSSAVVLCAALSVPLALLILIFNRPLASAMGAAGQDGLLRQTRDYLIGFGVGAPGSMGALMLVPFLQMAGQSGLLIAAVLTMTVADIAFDLLNVLVFHGGMLGMGLASSFSYYLALIVASWYFLSRRCVFRFSRGLVRRRKIAEILRSGVPAGFTMASSVILVFVINQILRGTGADGGLAALAAYTVIMALGNASCCVTTGVGGVTLTLTGIFYNEENHTDLRSLVRLMTRYGLVLGAGMAGLLLILAPALVSVFIPEGGAGSAREMAVLGLRLFAAGLIPCCLNCALKNAWQATGRVALTEVFSLLEGAVLPALAALVLRRFLGVTGVWFWFAAGELLALAGACVLIRVKSGSLPWQGEAALLLKPDFGVHGPDLMEAEIHDLAEVTAVSEAAERFCLSRGQDPRVASRIALCIEEMAGNVIRHGFTQDKRPHHLSVRVLKKPDGWILRFRDDCGAFDPVSFVPPEGQDALGIHLVLAMAQETRYTYSLNMNNLVLRLGPSGESGPRED